MFDSITFKNTVGPGPLLDIGAIAEAFLFYGRVSIVGNSATLKALLSGIPPFVVLGLLRDKRLEFHYLADQADFAEINAIYHTIVPPGHSTLTEAYLLAVMQGAYEATYYAAKLNTEIAVAPIERVVQSAAVEAVVRRRTQSEREIGSFVDLTMNDARTIREAVNSGRISFTQVVKLLDSADKFRHWLQQQPVDAELVRTYYQAVVKDSWADKLPGKSARWAVFTGLGLAADAFGTAPWGTLGGVAISAVDSFLCEKLISGWKPHQFVEGELKTLFITDQRADEAKKDDA